MTNTIWGGRFAASPSEIMEEINASIDFDKRLWRHDIVASKAHVAMLGATGIIEAKEADAIAAGLDTIAAEIEAGKFKFSRSLEDIHLNVEGRLRELIGPVAGKLHTARSRNDQVATDFKLYVRDETGAIEAGLAALQLALAKRRCNTRAR
jgi:argininosuccinate lyase